MRLLTILALILFRPSLWAESVLIIDNVTIISSHLTSPRREVNVVIVDGNITKISPVKVTSISHEQRVDGSGMYLVPGIMDSHVHVSSIPGLGFGVEPVARNHPEIAKRYYKQQPNSFLYHGVTQVLDPNPGSNWKKFTTAPVHPDYFRCEVITSINTFPYVEKQDEDSKSMYRFLVKENVPTNSPKSPESLVKKIANTGALCIKLYFEDGYGNANHWSLLSAETLKRIRKAAAEENLLILAHANAYDMYKQAIDAEVDVIVHGMWNWGEYDKSVDIPAPIAKVLDDIVTQNIGYMPTQRVIAGLGELMKPETKRKPEFNNITPEELLEWYGQPEADWFKKELRAGFDQLPDQTIANIFLFGKVGKGNKITAYLYGANHPLLLGSDFPGSPSYANQAGLTTYQEMKMMVESGVSLSEVLAAATINNARKFKIQAHYGTVEEGKIANLLLLNKNPLETIEAWDGIRFVILHGELIERESLAAQKMAKKTLQQINH